MVNTLIKTGPRGRTAISKLHVINPELPLLPLNSNNSLYQGPLLSPIYSYPQNDQFSPHN